MAVGLDCRDKFPSPGCLTPAVSQCSTNTAGVAMSTNELTGTRGGQ